MSDLSRYPLVHPEPLPTLEVLRWGFILGFVLGLAVALIVFVAAIVVLP